MSEVKLLTAFFLKTAVKMKTQYNYFNITLLQKFVQIEKVALAF